MEELALHQLPHPDPHHGIGATGRAGVVTGASSTQPRSLATQSPAGWEVPVLTGALMHPEQSFHTRTLGADTRQLSPAGQSSCGTEFMGGKVLRSPPASLPGSSLQSNSWSGRPGATTCLVGLFCGPCWGWDLLSPHRVTPPSRRARGLCSQLAARPLA